MINPYEFSVTRRPLCVTITKLLQMVQTLCWSLMFLVWGGGTVYLFASFLRNNAFKTVKKPAMQWWQDKLAAYAGTLESLLLATLAAIILILLLSLCRKLIKASRGAWIDAGGDLFIVAVLLYLGFLHLHQDLPWGRLAMLGVVGFAVLTLLSSLGQNVWGRGGRQTCEKLRDEARQCLDRQDFTKSKSLLNQALRHNPYCMETLYLLGESEHLSGNPPEAMAIYRLACEVGKMQALGDEKLEQLLIIMRKRMAELPAPNPNPNASQQEEAKT